VTLYAVVRVKTATAVGFDCSVCTVDAVDLVVALTAVELGSMEAARCLMYKFATASHRRSAHCSPALLWSLTEKPQFDGLNGYTGLENQSQQPSSTVKARFGELGQGRGDRPGMQGTGSDSNSRRSNWF
jgi:hypothetical protein